MMNGMEIPLSEDTRCTPDNPAFLAYVLLEVAGEMKADGRGSLGQMMEDVGARMALEYGRLPAGIAIPPEALQEARDMVLSEVKRQVGAMLAAHRGPKN